MNELKSVEDGSLLLVRQTSVCDLDFMGYLFFSWKYLSLYCFHWIFILISWLQWPVIESCLLFKTNGILKFQLAISIWKSFHGFQPFLQAFSEVNEYPWQAGLVSKGGSYVWCGGSLVNSRWVLTAAHCTVGDSPSSIQVYVYTLNELFFLNDWIHSL